MLKRKELCGGRSDTWCPLPKCWMDRLLLLPLLWNNCSWEKGVKAPEQSREFVHWSEMRSQAASWSRRCNHLSNSFGLLVWGVLLQGHFSRNIDRRTSVEEWQNAKERQVSNKGVSSLNYILKPMISPRNQLNSFIWSAFWVHLVPQ